MTTTAHHTVRRSASAAAAAAAHRPAAAQARQATQASHGEAGTCWTAQLEAGRDGHLQVHRGGVALAVRTAESCLLVPAAGDTVLCFGGAPDGIWVLSVLVRGAGSRERVLRCAGDTRLVVEHGQLTVEADRLRTASNHLEMRARTAAVSLDATEFVGDRVRMVAGTFKLVGSMLSTVMDRVNHFSQNYLRTTRGLDRVNAAHVECEATELLHLRGEHALINGAKLVKTRGAQIHFG